MDTMTVMVTSYPVLLVAVVGMWAIAMVAYAAVPRRTTHIRRGAYITQSSWVDTIDMDSAIGGYCRNKYKGQATVSGHYQAAKNLRKQGVPLEVAMAILFGDRHDHAT